MSEAFRGEFNQKVDSKARVSIPAAFRRALQAGDPGWSDGSRPKFVIVYGDDGRRFLECYTMSGIKRIEKLVRLLPLGTPKRRYMERNMITMSLIAEVDEEGRIVLPPKAREKIALSADEMKEGVEATFAGALESFQIWKRRTYEAGPDFDGGSEVPILAPGQDMLALLPDDPEV
ncbi:MAG: division/cell wall cluster transcriptional repressor MraZ [Pseudorhodobacter sp.]|nr:division/cell wall cluster transcriptional repressor MraZ [Pseudorhodobacter sp.]